MNKISKHAELTTQLHNTYVAKNKDYGDSFGKSISEFGLISGLVRISDKYERLKNLIQTETTPAVSESLHDTLLDLANYSIMLAIELEKPEP